MSFTSRRIREESSLRRLRTRAGSLDFVGWCRKHEVGKKAWKATVATAVIGKPLVRFFKTWKAQHSAEENRERRVLILKRTATILLSILICLLLFAGVTKALISMRIISMRSVLTVAGSTLPSDKDGFTNFLLLGHGGPNHDGVDLTDTIMVASLDPAKTKSAVLLSLPRDLYILNTEQMGKGRINSLYRDYKIELKQAGKGEEAASMEALKELSKEIGTNVDLEIHHVIKVDFDGFVKAVDALDGIDIDVPEDIVDVEYPGPNYTYQTFSIRAGPQHLDGDTALKYVRTRHTTSDFGRSARQQQVLSAIATKAKEQGLLTSPGTLMDLYETMAENMETSMTTRELLSVAAMGAEIERGNFLTMQLNMSNGLYGALTEPGGFLYAPPRELFDGASVLLPVSIPEYPVTWRQIHALGALLFRSRATYLQHPHISILNAGAQSGLGRKLSNELVRYGFDVPTTTNASLEKRDTSTILLRSEADRPVGTFFATLLHLPIEPLPLELPIEETGDVTILLGKDYVYTPLQALIPGIENQESADQSNE